MAETGRRKESLSMIAGRVVSLEGAVDGVEVPEAPFVWGPSKEFAALA